MLSLLKLYFVLLQLRALQSFLVSHFHVLQFHVLQIGPLFSCPSFSVNPYCKYLAPELSMVHWIVAVGIESAAPHSEKSAATTCTIFAAGLAPRGCLFYAMCCCVLISRSPAYTDIQIDRCNKSTGAMNARRAGRMMTITFDVGCVDDAESWS